MSGATAATEPDLKELYRELILDHSRNPRHFGKLPDHTHAADGINPLCGDKLRLLLLVGGDDRIQDARFEGSGCAISMASASLLTEAIIGTSKPQALEFAAAVAAHLRGDSLAAAQQIDLGKIRALEGVREFPARVKCATLSWRTLEAAFAAEPEPVTTEQ